MSSRPKAAPLSAPASLKIPHTFAVTPVAALTDGPVDESANAFPCGPENGPKAAPGCTPYCDMACPAEHEKSTPPLLPLPPTCVVGSFVERRKRFSVLLRMESGNEGHTAGQTDSTQNGYCQGDSGQAKPGQNNPGHGNPEEYVWVHSNNSGSMLGLTLHGAPVLASPASNPARKLKYTQECVWLTERATPRQPLPPEQPPVQFAAPKSRMPHGHGFWVGVNTSVPNRMLEAAFAARRLPFAAGYSSLTREAKRGQSRLDGLLTGSGLPPLWVECKNVTMVEDDAACFPDAASERGQKHLRELMDIVAHGERAAMLYLVQRPDGRCFAPADFIDPEYATLFYQALRAGVEMYPFRALVSPAGIDLGPLLPVRPAK